MKTDKKPEKKNQMKVASVLGLVAALVLVGAGMLGSDAADAAYWSWNNPPGNHPFARRSTHRKQDWQSQDTTMVAGKVIYAGPSHLEIQTRNNDYYFNAGGARVVNRDGSEIKIDTINKNDWVVAYGQMSNDNFFPAFVRDLSQR